MEHLLISFFLGNQNFFLPYQFSSLWAWCALYRLESIQINSYKRIFTNTCYISNIYITLICSHTPLLENIIASRNGLTDKTVDPCYRKDESYEISWLKIALYTHHTVRWRQKNWHINYIFVEVWVNSRNWILTSTPVTWRSTESEDWTSALTFF